ncbi:MAG: CPBP family intramembrane metalloprotease [Bdellovibrionaceae bacterium]|nr:CPBP family intramembrane metalloprotease [Pseudobdellovibrionaceae bacterium]
MKGIELQHVVRFLAFTFALSWLVMAVIIGKGGVQFAGLWILLVMWVPGLVSLCYRKVYGIGFRDVGWRLGPIRYAAIAFFVPFIVAGLSYAVLWGTGISEFNPPSNAVLTRNGVGSSLELILKTYPVIFLIGCFAALGEELGWRGFLIPKLYDTSLRYPLIVSSLIWGVWHFPLILWGGYASSSLPLVSILLFTVIILASGVFVGWLRIQSGSVWVAMVYHASHNLFLQTAFEVFNKPGPRSEFLGGESGVIPCAVYFLVLGTGWRLVKVKAKWKNRACAADTESQTH